MAGLKPCGTEAAYQRHRRRGESPCVDCVAAHSSLNAERKRALSRERREASKARLTVVEGDVGGERRGGGDAPLDAAVELRTLYAVLDESLKEAAPQYRAGIVREMRAVMGQLEKVQSGEGESLESVMGEALRRIGG